MTAKCLKNIRALIALYINQELECSNKIKVEVEVHTLLTLVVGGKEWLASYPGHFTVCNQWLRG